MLITARTLRGRHLRQRTHGGSTRQCYGRFSPWPRLGAARDLPSENKAKSQPERTPWRTRRVVPLQALIVRSCPQVVAVRLPAEEVGRDRQPLEILRSERFGTIDHRRARRMHLSTPHGERPLCRVPDDRKRPCPGRSAPIPWSRVSSPSRPTRSAACFPLTLDDPWDVWDVSDGVDRETAGPVPSRGRFLVVHT